MRDTCLRDGHGYCRLALNGFAPCFDLKDDADPAWGPRACDKLDGDTKRYKLIEICRGASDVVPMVRP